MWESYLKASEHDRLSGLAQRVENNENFYLGKQWEGLSAPDIEKPVLNFLKRAVNYFVAMLVSDDVGVEITPFNQNEGIQKNCELLEKEIARIGERSGIKAKHRDFLRNMAVHGDACFYLWFERSPGKKDGEIFADVIENTRVIFSNPYDSDVQRQPRIFITSLREVSDIKADIAKYLPGQPEEEYADFSDSGDPDYATCVLMLEKDRETGKVWATEFCEKSLIRPRRNTGCELYPVVYASWEKLRTGYRGQGVITALIPNQIFVNKLWAMAMEQVKATAFPKVIYNRSAFPDGWQSGAGRAVGVYGNPNEAVATSFKAADMSYRVLELVDRTIAYTKEFMGATDTALGNVRPDNTSAIIAVQKASAAPLELQRLAYYRAVEDYIRIMLDMIRSYYGVREHSAGEEGTDFSRFEYDAFELNVRVGAGSYWSELMQVRTLDNLFGKGIVSDAVTYLESIPDGYVKNKQTLLKKLRERGETMKPEEVMF